METDSIEQVERANYTLVRVRRDILRKSDVGAFFTNKLSADGQGHRLYGTDMNFNFFKYLEISSFVFKTDSPGEHGKDMSTYAEVGWKDDRFDIAARRLTVDEKFDPQMGYVAHTAIQKISKIHPSQTIAPGDYRFDENYFSLVSDRSHLTPLSDLYLVYNERRMTGGSVLDRALILKLTRIFSF